MGRYTLNFITYLEHYRNVEIEITIEVYVWPPCDFDAGCFQINGYTLCGQYIGFIPDL